MNSRWSTYLKEQQNVLFVLNCQKFNDYNKYLLSEMGIKNKVALKLLNYFSAVAFVLVCVYSFFYISVLFIVKLVSAIIARKKKEDELSGQVMLLYTPLFVDRVRKSNITIVDEKWIVGPNVDKKYYDDFNAFSFNLNCSDIVWAYKKSVLTLVEYLINPLSLYPIYKSYEFYEQYSILKDRLSNCDIFFSNQSDRWALMFDEIKSKSKTILQHGITLEVPLPHTLKNIDYFYVLSENTIMPVQNSILSCHPRFFTMPPSIDLTRYDGDKPKVLIVSNLSFIELEKQILDILTEDNKIDIFLKKHPTLKNDSCYQNLKSEYGFNYITESIFPKVDYVLSYFSTLAYEYMAYNIPVCIYSQEDNKLSEIRKIKNNLISKFNIIQQNV